MYLNWLWTNRLKWIKHKHKSKSCLFCRIAKNDKKIKAYVLFNDGKTVVMLNLFPYNTGHLLIFPVRHVKSLQRLTEKELMELFLRVKNSIKLLKKALNPVGFNVGINIGEIASASVEHLHVHVVPRFRRDLGFMELTAETKVMPEPVEKTYKKLKKYCKLLKD